MPRLYHPHLEPPSNVITVPDDEGCVAAHEESGWKLAPESEAENPALAPEPIEYEPVKPKARGKPARSGES